MKIETANAAVVRDWQRVGHVAAAAVGTGVDTRSVLEEVIVTAEKREVNLQEVPVAVPLTRARRARCSASTQSRISRASRPVSTYRNDDRLAIRGVGRLTNAVGTDPAVALYSDGIFSTSMADTSTPPLFIERTEILRGPQGTLYGRNSVGGAINVISKRPTDDFEGEVRATGANYSYYRGEGLIRGPFTDNFRYLVGGYVEKRDEGFIKNSGPAEDGATSDRWMVEGQLEADLGENVVARVRYSKFEWEDTYGVGNTLLHRRLTVRYGLPYNARPLLQLDVRLHRPEPRADRSVYGRHQPHGCRHAQRSQPHSSGCDLGSRRRDAEVLRRLSGVSLSHGLRQRRHAAHWEHERPGAGWRTRRRERRCGSTSTARRDR